MKFSFLILIAFLGILSCKPVHQEAEPDFSGQEKKKNESLIKINNYVAKRNQELIAQFVRRTGLKMSETGSGLWYGIYYKGKGKKVQKNDIVKISYDLKLLDGTPIEKTLSENPKEFIVGKGNIEAGLQEGILLLNEGDSVLFILPPHLAYGNFGNDQKIPPGAFLFYDMSLLKIKPVNE